MAEDFDPFVELEKEQKEAIKPIAITTEKKNTELEEALNHLKTCLDTMTDVIKSLDRWQRYNMDKALAFFKRHREIRYWP